MKKWFAINKQTINKWSILKYVVSGFLMSCMVFLISLVCYFESSYIASLLFFIAFMFMTFFTYILSKTFDDKNFKVTNSEISKNMESGESFLIRHTDTNSINNCYICAKAYRSDGETKLTTDKYKLTHCKVGMKEDCVEYYLSQDDRWSENMYRFSFDNYEYIYHKFSKVDQEQIKPKEFEYKIIKGDF